MIAHVRFQSPPVELPGPAPRQAPQCPCRKDDREHRGHAECEKCPNEEEGFAGPTDLAAENAPGSLHVDDGDYQPKERPEKDNDVPRSPFGERKRSVQPNDQDDNPYEIWEPRRRHFEENVVGQVKRHEKNRKQRRDG